MYGAEAEAAAAAAEERAIKAGRGEGRPLHKEARAPSSPSPRQPARPGPAARSRTVRGGGTPNAALLLLRLLLRQWRPGGQAAIKGTEQSGLLQSQKGKEKKGLCWLQATQLHAGLQEGEEGQRPL